MRALKWPRATGARQLCRGERVCAASGLLPVARPATTRNHAAHWRIPAPRSSPASRRHQTKNTNPASRPGIRIIVDTCRLYEGSNDPQSRESPGGGDSWDVRDYWGGAGAALTGYPGRVVRLLRGAQPGGRLLARLEDILVSYEIDSHRRAVRMPAELIQWGAGGPLPITSSRRVSRPGRVGGASRDYEKRPGPLPPDEEVSGPRSVPSAQRHENRDRIVIESRARARGRG
jgi:hypothetical protein